MADDNFAEVALTEKPDTRPVCSAATPAPNGRVTAHGNHRWDYNWQHPAATEREINADHGDIRCDCPHCGCYWIYEGPDA